MTSKPEMIDGVWMLNGKVLGRPDQDGWIKHDGAVKGPVDGTGMLCDFIMSDDREYLGQKHPRFWHLVSKWRPHAPVSRPAGEGEREAVALADLRTIKSWLVGLSTNPDLNDVVADGGVTVGMCYQQEAREFAGRIDRALSLLSPAAPDAGGGAMDALDEALIYIERLGENIERNDLDVHLDAVERPFSFAQTMRSRFPSLCTALQPKGER